MPRLWLSAYLSFGKMLFRRINIRNWEITFAFLFGKEDADSIVRLLAEAEASDKIIETVRKNILRERDNEGFCFSNPSLRKSVAGIGYTSSGEEFLNSSIHEIIHLVQDIAKTDGLDPYGESAAYFGGDISSKISDIVCRFSCDKCREAS